MTCLCALGQGRHGEPGVLRLTAASPLPAVQVGSGVGGCLQRDPGPGFLPEPQAAVLLQPVQEPCLPGKPLGPGHCLYYTKQIGGAEYVFFEGYTEYV